MKHQLALYKSGSNQFERNPCQQTSPATAFTLDHIWAIPYEQDQQFNKQEVYTE